MFTLVQWYGMVRYGMVHHTWGRRHDFLHLSPTFIWIYLTQGRWWAEPGKVLGCARAEPGPRGDRGASTGFILVESFRGYLAVTSCNIWTNKVMESWFLRYKSDFDYQYSSTFLQQGGDSWIMRPDYVIIWSTGAPSPYIGDHIHYSALYSSLGVRVSKKWLIICQSAYIRKPLSVLCLSHFYLLSVRPSFC